MALTVQNLRAVGTGVEPASLLPGQIAFNVTDKVIYVGDGSNFKTAYDGTQVVGVPGEGWYAMPMDFDSLGEYYVVNPGYYGDVPTDQQVLTWSTALNHPIWTSGGGGGGGNQVYVVTNAQVAVAPGSTTSAKITAAIGVASPDEGDVTIVTGLPDDVYEGLYFFTTEWVKGAAYAYPSASEVIYDNTAHPTLTPTVQGAIDDLDDGLIATTAIANTANSTATSALSIANAALPKAGGTMTGTIVAQDIDIQSGYELLFAGGASGILAGVSDSTSSVRSDTAASSVAVTAAYQLANAALPRTGGIMTGPITFVAGQLFPISGIQVATTGQLGVVQVGANIEVAAGVISVLTSTTSNKGVVQLSSDLASGTATEALTAAAGVSLQSQIDNLTLASNVILGGSFDCVLDQVDSTTAAGATVGLAVGSDLPVPTSAFNDIYVVVTVAGSYSPPGGGGPYNAQSGDWFLCGETALGSGIYVWQYLGVGARPAYATTTSAGIVQLATPALTQSGVSATLAVTPAGLQSKVSDSTSTVSSTTIASSTAVKSAYDLGFAALPMAGGTMTGDLTFSGAGVGVVFDDASTVEAISDSVATTSSVTAASATAVKSAYDLATTANNTANAALPKAGGTMTGAITFVAGQVFPVSGIQDATTAQKGIVQVGTNIDVSSGTISVKSSTTSQSGVVQLNDTLASTSTTQALTANMGRDLQVQINALATSNNLTFAGTIDGATGLMLTVTVEGGAAGFTVGNVMPSPSAAIKEYFTIISVAGTMTPPGGVPTQTYVGDWWLASSSTWTYIAAGFQPPYASTTTPGLVRLSTNAETQTGTDATEAVTPASLQSKVSDSVSTTSSIAIASSTAVKSAYDLANAAVPQSCYTALGSLVAGTGSGTIGTLGIGTTGQVLAANTACSTGLQWCTISLACIPCSAFTASGQLLAGTGTNTFTALGAGSNGQFLAVDNTCTGGLKWVTAAGANICGFTCALTPFNTALGFGAGALFSNLSVANTAIGYFALDSEVSGDFNTAVGHNALTAQNGPTGNTAVGGNAGAQIVGGSCNTIMGYNSGDALTTGSNNTALGFNSLGASISGTCNVAVGVNALAAAVTSTGTVAVGANALAANTSGAGNTAIGFNAGLAITTGSNNTILGFNAADNITTGTQNTFLGACTGGSVAITSEGNTAVGFSALGQGITSGAYNVAVGTNAGLGVTSGALNTLVGFSAGSAITTGGSNTLVGRYAGTATLANNVVLSDGAGTIRFQANATGAWSPNGTNFGTSGAILMSNGTGAPPAWTTSAGLLPNYGSFLSTTSQTNLDTTNGNAATFNTTTENRNVSVQSNSRLTVASAGTYNIQFSAQVTKTDAGSDDINIWFKKNGVNIDNSATNITLVGNNTPQLATVNFILTLAANDYVEIWWWSADVNVVLLAETAAAPYPAIPSIIATVVPVGA